MHMSLIYSQSTIAKIKTNSQTYTVGAQSNAAICPSVYLSHSLGVTVCTIHPRSTAIGGRGHAIPGFRFVGF